MMRVIIWVFLAAGYFGMGTLWPAPAQTAVIVEKDGKTYTFENISYEKYSRGTYGFRQSAQQKQSFEVTFGRIQAKIPFDKIQKAEFFEKGRKVTLMLMGGRAVEGETFWWENGDAIGYGNPKEIIGRAKVKGFEADFVMPLSEIKEITFRTEGPRNEIVADVTGANGLVTAGVNNVFYCREPSDPFTNSSSMTYLPLKIAEIGATILKIDFDKIKSVEMGDGQRAVVTLQDGDRLEGKIELTGPHDKLRGVTKFEGFDAAYISSFENIKSITFMPGAKTDK